MEGQTARFSEIASRFTKLQSGEGSGDGLTGRANFSTNSITFI